MEVEVAFDGVVATLAPSVVGDFAAAFPILPVVVVAAAGNEVA